MNSQLQRMSLCSFLPLFLTLSFLALPSVATAPKAPARKTPRIMKRETVVPYSVQWGSYVVSVSQIGTGRRFLIKDAKGVVLQDIQGAFIHDVDFPDLDGTGSTNYVRVVVCPESNLLADIRTFCFTRRGGLKPVLTLPHVFNELRDLDGDGRPELLSWNAAPFEWIDPLAHGYDPDLFLILGWNGRAYEIQNRTYPKLVRREAASSLDQFRKGYADYQKRLEHSYQKYLSGALGYWGQMATIGKEKDAEKVLRKALSKVDYEDFLTYLPEIRDRLKKVPAMIGAEVIGPVVVE